MKKKTLAKFGGKRKNKPTLVLKKIPDGSSGENSYHWNIVALYRDEAITSFLDIYDQKRGLLDPYFTSGQVKVPGDVAYITSGYVCWDFHQYCEYRTDFILSMIIPVLRESLSRATKRMIRFRKDADRAQSRIFIKTLGKKRLPLSFYVSEYEEAEEEVLRLTNKEARLLEEVKRLQMKQPTPCGISDQLDMKEVDY